ncbi:hypothetical protein BDR07DRAFT_1387220 [Suillus spraguei]|nr:hypothetical protein BDR07DRAFT_1387220 [Suillus spraguei]
MHTQNNGGTDTDLAMDLDTNFAWTPLLASQSQADDELEGPESLTEDEVAALPLTRSSNALQNSHQLLIPSWKRTKSWRERCMTLQSCIFTEVHAKNRSQRNSARKLSQKRYFAQRIFELWNRLTKELSLRLSKTMFSRWDLTWRMIYLGMCSLY